MAKKRILIVDNEVKYLQLLKTALENTGLYEVREAENGPQALAIARATKPDLVLLDLIMPVMDGASVAAEIKADPSLRDIPLVFLTSAITKEEAEAERGMIGGHPFIAKMVGLPEVIQEVVKHLK